MNRLKYRLVLGLTTCWMLLSGCNIPDKSSQLDFEIAGETALAYLNQKYDEEFVLLSGSDRRDSILGGEKWYRGTVIRKAEEDCGSSYEYEVNVTFDGENYTVAGDTFMFSYVQELAENYLEPIISENMYDLKYSLVVTRSAAENPDYGFPADIQIPYSEDELYEIHEDWRSIEFRILMPLSDENSELPDICNKINADLKSSRFKFVGYLVTIADDEYERIVQSDDLYFQYINGIDDGRYSLYQITD